MTSGLALAYDHDAGRVVLEGLPVGVAGGAGLVPVPGLDLVFDRADGRLARLTVDSAEPGRPPALGEDTAAVLTSLLGRRAPGEVRRVATQPGARCILVPEPGSCAALSRLARLDAARSTSPVPAASPLWAAEAALLANRAGLQGRARAEARQAVARLAGFVYGSRPPDALAEAALAVADLAGAEEPGRARELRQALDDSLSVTPDRRLAGQAQGPGRPGLPGGACPGPDIPGLQWAFDPGLVPEGVFLPGLSPLFDLVVRPGEASDRVVVEAQLTPGAGRAVLDRCRARLVDPGTRRVLACGAFIEEGAYARAELLLPFSRCELTQAWIEVVDDERRPVRGAQLRQRRRAVRWADAALRAEQRPHGLAPRFTGGDWAALADTAWAQCRGDWEGAGDADRAFLAAMRLPAVSTRARIPEAPSAWAATLAGHRPLREPAYLAEVLEC
ncbi:MAG TPA: hypothetical protein VH307_02030 [Streptosporangiaceae bacterium]|jgi:hypothetical protein|nr:hypothetical protein [Streptosporangiaceae bacterium]